MNGHDRDVGTRIEDLNSRRTKANSERGHRYIEEVVVIDTFADSTEALRRYSELYRQEPEREYCFFYLNYRITRRTAPIQNDRKSPWLNRSFY